MQKRKRIKRADLILTSDWHLRDDQPTCRTDNYVEAQNKKINFVLELSEKYKCEIIHAGDLFHKPKSSKSLEIYLMQTIPKLYTIPGQHDLPNHNIKNINDSSIGILSNSETIYLSNTKLNDVFYNVMYKKSKIGVVHTFIQKPGDKQDKLIGGSAAISFLKKHKEFDLIVSGDNHKTFVVEYQGRLLVNPGSLMRMTAAQINHRPCIFLYYAYTNTVKQVFIPIEKDIISRDHIEVEEKKEKRFQAFVTRLNQDYEVSLSFEKNIEKHIRKNRVRKSVEALLWETIG